jgi:TetR/AcrR family transcriptional regulator, transcriptional repressor for nem operon
MRVSREKAAEHRERIIDAAGALFRTKGFGGIGVADIMKAADLTHGGFYGHFASKDDLVAQASRRAMARAAVNWTKVVADAPEEPYAALLSHYLSPRHRDAARCGKPVREAFAEGLQSLIDILADTIPGRSKAVRRRKALAAMAALVGALTLARAVDDASLSGEILEAAQRELLTAGR